MASDSYSRADTVSHSSASVVVHLFVYFTKSKSSSDRGIHTSIADAEPLKIYQVDHKGPILATCAKVGVRMSARLGLDMDIVFSGTLDSTSDVIGVVWAKNSRGLDLNVKIVSLYP